MTPHPVGPHIEANCADYDVYLHAFRAAVELRQAARGRPRDQMDQMDQMDPTIPARTPDASEEPTPQVSRGAAQIQARERHRQALTPGRRQWIAVAAAERRARHGRAYEQPRS